MVFFFLTAARLAAAEKAAWLWLDSPHFEMLTDASEETARGLLTELEQFRAVFLKFSASEPEIGMRTTVVLFATESGFEPYKPLYQGRAKSVAGFFSGSPINGFMAVGRGENLAETKRTIYHEYVHSLYNEIGWVPPLWLNEGTAEVFSTFEVRKGVAYLGRAPTIHARILSQMRLLPMDRLLAIGHGSPEYNETLKQGIFYAQSWALAHYLICNPDQEWRARLNALLPRLNEGGLDEAGFRAALGIGFADMTARLESYVRGGRYLVFKNEIPAGVSLSVRPAPPQEREVVLRLLEAGRNPATVDYQLIVLSEKHPQSARVREAIATRALRSGDMERARDYLWRAIEVETTNTRVHWFLAQELVQAWLTREIGPDKRIGEATAAKLRLLLARVVAENPVAIDAWEALARTEAFAPEPDRRTLEKILAVTSSAPADIRLVQAKMLVAFAFGRLGESETATTLARQVEADPIAVSSTKAMGRRLLPAAGR